MRHLYDVDVKNGFEGSFDEWYDYKMSQAERVFSQRKIENRKTDRRDLRDIWIG